LSPPAGVPPTTIAESQGAELPAPRPPWRAAALGLARHHPFPYTSPTASVGPDRPAASIPGAFRPRFVRQTAYGGAFRKKCCCRVC
jgi:hypothetical protein